jgi:hypothetical protein
MMISEDFLSGFRCLMFGHIFNYAIYDLPSAVFQPLKVECHFFAMLLPLLRPPNVVYCFFYGILKIVCRFAFFIIQRKRLSADKFCNELSAGPLLSRIKQEIMASRTFHLKMEEELSSHSFQFD